MAWLLIVDLLAFLLKNVTVGNFSLGNKTEMSEWTANFKLMVTIPSCKTDLWSGKADGEDSLTKNNSLLQFCPTMSFFKIQHKTIVVAGTFDTYYCMSKCLFDKTPNF